MSSGVALPLARTFGIVSGAGLAVEDVILQTAGQGKQVFIVGSRPRVGTVLDRPGVMRLPPADRIRETGLAARARLSPTPNRSGP